MGVVFGAKIGPNLKLGPMQCYEKNKETGISIGFFSYFAWGIATFTSKRYLVVIEIPEWKLNRKTPHISLFEGN